MDAFIKTKDLINKPIERFRNAAKNNPKKLNSFMLGWLVVIVISYFLYVDRAPPKKQIQQFKLELEEVNDGFKGVNEQYNNIKKEIESNGKDSI